MNAIHHPRSTLTLVGDGNERLVATGSVRAIAALGGVQRLTVVSGCDADTVRVARSGVDGREPGHLRLEGLLDVGAICDGGEGLVAGGGLRAVAAGRRVRGLTVVAGGDAHAVRVTRDGEDGWERGRLGGRLHVGLED